MRIEIRSVSHQYEIVAEKSDVCCSPEEGSDRYTYRRTDDDIA